MNNIDYTILSNRTFDFSKNNKLYIKDNKVKVGVPEEGSVSDLRQVIAKLSEKNVSFLPNNSTLTNNLQRINAKVISRNEKIKNNFFLDTLDFLLKKMGFFGLTINELPISYQIPVSIKVTTPETNIKKASEEPKVQHKNPEEKVKNLFKDGMLCSLNKSFESPLTFFPDRERRLISRELRAELVAKALFIAPPQPSDRAFEYVGFGTGPMRQDLHQVMGLIDQGINEINISLIDIVYAPENHPLKEDARPFAEAYGENWDPQACVEEFKEVIRLRAPHVKVQINVYASTEDWVKDHAETRIDLLTAIRVSKDSSKIKPQLEILKGKMADSSGALISTDVNNSQEIQCRSLGNKVDLSEAIKLKKNQCSDPDRKKQLEDLAGVVSGCDFKFRRDLNQRWRDAEKS